MDVFEGYSKHLLDNIDNVFKRDTTNRIIKNMQKPVVADEHTYQEFLKY